MWITFFGICVLACIACYSVGYLFLRVLSFSRVDAFLAAPLFSTLAFSLMGFALAYAGITASWVSVFVAPLVVFALVYVVKTLVAKKTRMASSPAQNTAANAEKTQAPAMSTAFFGQANFRGALVVVATGIIVASLVFLVPLTNPESFSSQWDNGLHINLPAAFLESGSWSFMQASSFANYASTPEMYFDSAAGFYPASFHVLVTLIMSVSGVSVAFAINVVLFVFAGIIYPLAMYALLSVLFKDKPVLAIAGALLALLPEAFPWGLIEFGPLYPNEVSYGTLPLVLALFIALFEDPHQKTDYAKLIATIVLGCISLALLQPNAVFVAVIILYPYCCVKIFCFAKAKAKAKANAKNHSLVLPIVACVVWSVFCAGVWLVLYKSPITPVFNWPQTMSVIDALLACITLGFEIQIPEVLLAILLIVGLISCIVHKRRRWLIFAWLGACLLFVLATATESSLKRVLTLFWYTDYFRLAAAAAIAAVPLMAEGVLCLVELLEKAFPSFSQRVSAQKQSVGIALVVCLVVAVIQPLVFKQGALTYFQNAITSKYALNCTDEYVGSQTYTADERAFVNKVAEIVEGEHVLNCPYDGSLFAYGLDGLQTCYRTLGVYDTSPASEKTLRLSLANYLEDPAAQAALALTQVKYLLVLDSIKYPSNATFYGAYETCESNWTGFLSVTDDTPGFSVVLAENDMRLYRIDSVE